MTYYFIINPLFFFFFYPVTFATEKEVETFFSTIEEERLCRKITKVEEEMIKGEIKRIDG